MIDLRYLRHFLAVASHPTVQAAADALHITQPALTKSIARFEEELGETLFDRRGHKLILTEFGERLVWRGEELLSQVNDLEEEVEQWKSLETGEIGLGVDPAAELSLLPAVLENFVPAYPGISVTIRSGHADSLIPRLRRGELHFLIAESTFALEIEELEIQELAHEPIVLAVRPDHPVTKTPWSSIQDLSNYRFASATSTQQMETWTAEQSRREGVSSKLRTLTCDNYEVLVRLALSSDTILGGPLSVMKSFDERLTILTMPYENMPTIHPSLIRTVGRRLPPAAEKFIELLLDTAARQQT
jgi:DNA-binding transcriptional LysR family regulator